MAKELIRGSPSSLLGPPQGEGLPTREQAATAVRVVRSVYEEAGAVDFQTFLIGDACTMNATPQSDLDVAVDNLAIMQTARSCIVRQKQKQKKQPDAQLMF